MIANIIWKITKTSGGIVCAVAPEYPGTDCVSIFASPAKWNVPIRPCPPQSTPNAKLYVSQTQPRSPHP